MDLVDLAPPRTGRPGRPRTRGDRLPKPPELAKQVTNWTSVKVCVRGQMIERQLWSRTLCGTRQPALVLSCSSSLAIPVPLAQAPSVRFGSVRADGKMSAVGELVGAMLPDRALLPPLRRCPPDHPRPAERQAPRRRSGTPPPA
jgi:hypothetical protein